MYYFFNKYNVIYHDLFTLSIPESAIFSPPPAAKFVQFFLSYCQQMKRRRFGAASRVCFYSLFSRTTVSTFAVPANRSTAAARTAL